jgi:hypothetical protein
MEVTHGLSIGELPRRTRLADAGLVEWSDNRSLPLLPPRGKSSQP